MDKSEISETDYKYFKITFRPHVEELTAIFITTGYNTGISGWYEVDESSLKLERGNKPTDWSPAPEDNIELISSIQTEWTQTFEDFETSVTGSNGRLTLAEQFLDGFKNTAFDPSTGQLSLTEQTINGLQDTVSDPVNGLETKYTQLSGLIDLRVTSTQAKAISEAEILADKTIKDTRNDNQTPEWYFTNYPKQTVKEFKKRATIGTPGLQRYVQLSTEVPWSESSGGRVVQTANSADGVYRRYSNTDSSTWLPWEKIADTSYVESQFSILDNKILAKVSEGDVYSQLLIDSRNILFDANDRIMLSANKVVIDASEGTFISGAVIENASIDSAKISEIDANQVRVINLDADSISVSDLSSITSSTGALNVDNWITIMNENFGIRGSFDYGDTRGEAFNPRWFIGDWYAGKQFMRYRADVYAVTMNGEKAYYKYYSDTFFGSDYVKLRQYEDNSASNLSARVDITADKIQITDNWNRNTGIILRASGQLDVGAFLLVYGDAEFQKGLAVYGGAITAGRIETLSSYNTFQINEYRNDLGSIVLSESGAWLNQGDKGGYAEVWVGKDSYNNQIFRAPVMRNTTTSLAPNMYVSPSGIVQSSSSSARFKLNIRTAEESLDVGNKILGLPVRKWNDKFETETIAEELSSGINNTEWPELRLKSYWGFIAEELEEKGLEQFVTRNLEGKLDGIQYAQMWIPLVPVIKDHKERIEMLEAELIIRGERE